MALPMDFILSRVGSPSEKTRLISELVSTPSSGTPGTTELATLQICFQLLESAKIQLAQDAVESDLLDTINPTLGRLCRSIIHSIAYGKNDNEGLIGIAELCLASEERTCRILGSIEQILCITTHLLIQSKESECIIPETDFLDRYLPNDNQVGEAIQFQSTEERIPAVLRCLAFLKCFFEMSPEYNCRVPLRLVSCLIALLGCTKDLATSAHYALSALMPVVEKMTFSQNGEESDVEDLFGEQIWNRICALLADPSKFETSGAVFKLWFQWAYQTGRFGPSTQHLQQDQYWSLLQLGLRHGYGEQRKYCLGVLQCSLPKASSDIRTTHMSICIDQRPSQQLQYEKYCTLFEAIVLDRYANQVEACLGELSTLMEQSHVHTTWMTTLLSSALSPKVQDSIRKIIGYWYMDFINDKHPSLPGHSDFIFEGFLPWATQGFLFTASLSTSRSHTTCGHGSALSKMMETFVVGMPTGLKERQFLRGVLQFVLDRRGRLFQYSTIYLIEGLLQGFRSSDSFGCLEENDLHLILQASRQPGLPEIARDLCASLGMQFFEKMDPDISTQVVGYDQLNQKIQELSNIEAFSANVGHIHKHLRVQIDSMVCPVEALNRYIQESKHKAISGVAITDGCQYLLNLLNSGCPQLAPTSLHGVLEAIWDEADTQDFPRRVAKQLPPLFFHPRCLELCIRDPEEAEPLRAFLEKVLVQLHGFAEGKSYLLAVLATSIRQACLMYPETLTLLPVEDFLVRFTTHPPTAKDEFLFEGIAADKLSTTIPHRTYEFYYGKREWHAYASIIDLLNRFPTTKLDVAKRVLDRVLYLWSSQQPTSKLIISKWKDTFQLHVLLILGEACIEEAEAERYLDQYWHALTVESWPKYRYLLEWIVARIYMRYPNLARQGLLKNLSDASAAAKMPRQIATWMKLSVLAAFFVGNAEDFAQQLMVYLVSFSASPKVQIRFEAHWSVTILWGLAEEKGWSSILDNTAYSTLNQHIRSQDKWESTATQSRRSRLDVVNDHTLVNIFQGDYIHMDQPEVERVTYDDFTSLWAEDEQNGFVPPPLRIPLGTSSSKVSASGSQADDTEATPEKAESSKIADTPLQTKSGADLSSMITTSPTSQKRPTTLILVASLIDNPTNLGGLSRISEIFGIETLYIRSLDVLGSKDFQSTAVTSHNHFPIKALPVPEMPTWLLEKKREGYTVVCIEQTDRSFVLGEIDGDVITSDGTARGSLPKKCVLVLGSEREGVSKEVLACADRCVEIRQVGVTRSLNVQTAGGIVIWEWWREWGNDVREK